MKILNVISGEHYAGAERVQEYLLNSLETDERFESAVVVYKKGVFLDRASLDGSTKIIEFVNEGLLRCIKKIITYSPDVIHSHSPITLLLGKIFTFFMKVRPVFVYHVHSPVLEDTEHYLKNKIKYWLERLFLDFDRDYLLCVSTSVKDKSPHFIKAKNLKVINNGVPVFSGERKFKEDDVFRISFAGLIRRRKGIEVLIRAVSKLPNELNSRLMVDVYGVFETAEYEAEVFRLLTSLDVVHCFSFHGFKKDIIREITSSHVFVIPSLYGEGLPMVLLEAMSAGIAVVASRTDGIPEVIEDGNSGLLFLPGDDDELAQKIELIFSDGELRSLLANNAQKNHRDRYSNGAMCDGIKNVYIGG